MQIICDEIWSFFLSSVEAFDIAAMEDEKAEKVFIEHLKKTTANPKLFNIFASIELDETNKTLDFELKRKDLSVGTSENFIISLLSRGMVVEWLTPKYLTILNTSQMFGGKEQKFYSQANHMEQLRQMLENARLELDRMIRDFCVG